MTEEVIRRVNKDTTDLAGEQDTSQVMWYEVWSKLQPGGFLQILDESAWQSPRLQSDAGVQPTLDPCQASSLLMSAGNGGFSSLQGAYPDSTWFTGVLFSTHGAAKTLWSYELSSKGGSKDHAVL